MKNTYTAFLFTLCLFWGIADAQQVPEGLQIRIQKNENGNETILIRNLEKDNIAALEKMIDAEDILKTLGMPGENEEIEVIIRKRTLNNHASAQAPEPETDIQFHVPMPEISVQKGKAFLGVYYNPSPTPEGTLVTSVVENSPASKAGIVGGDFILKVDGQAPTETKDLRSIITQYESGKKVKIEILRNGEGKKFHVVLGENQTPEPQERKMIVREPKAKLGVVIDPVAEENGTMIVAEVLPGTLAEKLGLKNGDQLVNLNKMPIDSRSDITMALLEGVDGQDFKAEWWRDGKMQSAVTKFDAAPAIIAPQCRGGIRDCKNIDIKIAELDESILAKDAIVYRFRKIPSQSADKNANTVIKDPEMKLEISPNPSSGQMKVDFFIPDANQVTLTVFDLEGRLVLKKEFDGKNISQSINISLENETSGTYTVNLVWEGGKISRKVVIRK